MRVHERGVGETRACGTGTVAVTAADLHLLGASEGSRAVHMPGGRVDVRVATGEATMTGRAEFVASGELTDAWWAAQQERTRRRGAAVRRWRYMTETTNRREVPDSKDKRLGEGETDLSVGEWELEGRAALRRVAGLSTELTDITEVEYRRLRLERVVLVGVWTEGTAAQSEASLAELARLAETAGSQVLEGLVQRRDRPDPAT